MNDLVIGAMQDYMTRVNDAEGNGANPPLQLVNVASYEPFGPLKTLVLGNSLIETRAFDNRYAPSEIRVDGASPVLDWSYTTDPVGNITGITDLPNAANNRTYAYQDIQYFLTQGNGPWGPRSWTYDRIGDRLTETRGTVTDTYAYPTNTAGGRNPKLFTTRDLRRSVSVDCRECLGAAYED